MLTPGRGEPPGQGQVPRTHMAAHLLRSCRSVSGLHTAPWGIKRARAKCRCTLQAPGHSVCRS